MPDTIRVWLDDERPAPSEEWTTCRWPDEVIALIEKGNVEAVSLDYFLGDFNRGEFNRTGEDVLKWLLTKVVEPGFVLPRILIHSSSEEAKYRMKGMAREVYRLYEQRKINDATQT